MWPVILHRPASIFFLICFFFLNFFFLIFLLLIFISKKFPWKKVFFNYLSSKSVFTAVYNTLKWLITTMWHDVLLQPGFWRGTFTVNLAAFPKTLVLDTAVGISTVSITVTTVSLIFLYFSNSMNILKKSNFKVIFNDCWLLADGKPDSQLTHRWLASDWPADWPLNRWWLTSDWPLTGRWLAAD